MITLIQNADVYAPRHLGMRDVLLEGGKIALIAPCGEIPSRFPTLQTVDAAGSSPDSLICTFTSRAAAVRTVFPPVRRNPA